MKNILTFMEKNGGIPFSVLPLCEVDSLILSELSYVNFKYALGSEDELPLRKIKVVDAMFERVIDGYHCRILLLLARKSRRYRDVRIKYHIDSTEEEAEKQFSATVFRIDNYFSYIAFRGTDLTLVGWKEDFNMAFMRSVPSQLSAAEYLGSVAPRLSGAIAVGGHSKGGNLAVYAAASAGDEILERITAVYCHDGPGFGSNSEISDDKIDRIRGKIRKTVPQGSFIGMLFDKQCEYRVVKCSGFGAMQHLPFAWAVKGADFDCTEKQTAVSRRIRKSLNAWISSTDDETRREFVEALYDILLPFGNADFAKTKKDLFASAKAVMARIKSTDPKTKKMLMLTVKELAVMMK